MVGLESSYENARRRVVDAVGFGFANRHLKDNTLRQVVAIYHRNMTEPLSVWVFVVLAAPMYYVSASDIVANNSILYSAWLDADNYISTYGTRQEQESILRNRSCWQFFYTHMNNASAGTTKSNLGSTDAVRTRILKLMGKSAHVTAIGFQREDHIPMYSHSLREYSGCVHHRVIVDE